MEQSPKDDPSRYPALGRALLFLDKKKNVDRVVLGLYIACALLFLADFAYKKKTYLGAEDLPGFYAIYGFVMCAFLVICAKGMRIFLNRREDFYAPHDVEAEDYPEDQLDRARNDD